MGACNFSNMATAKNAGEAFDNLVEDAVYEYGHSGYNGTISTCCLGRCTLSFKKFDKANIDSAYKHIEDMDWGNKWTADYVDLGTVDNGNHKYLFYGWASC